MKFKIEKWKIDFGETSVENMFINNYLPSSTGDQIKVYLYGLKLAGEGLGQSDKELAENLDMEEEEIKAIWDYWENLNLIEKKKDSIIFKSLRQMYLGIFVEAEDVDEAEEEIEKEEDYFSEPEKMISKAEEESIAMMIEQIEMIMGVNIHPNQMAKLLTNLKDYPLDINVAIMSFTFAFNQLEIRDFDYALGVWRKWYIAGIRDVNDLEEHLKKEESKKVKRREKKTSFNTSNPDQKEYTDDELEKLIEQKMKRRGR